MTNFTDGSSARQHDRNPATGVDEDLLRQVAAGDREAFSVLYDRVSARVLWQVQRSLIDHAQSEEVTQEVFLEVWQRASRFDPSKGRALTWVMTLAHRRAVDRVRSGQASRDRDRTIGIRDYRPPFDETAEAVETRLEHARVTRAMDRITPIQRQMVTLAYDHGHTAKEISGLLGLPLGTVKTRLRDGLIRLRHELGVA